MTTMSEIILDRYKKSEVVADTLGRMINVSPLTMPQQVRILEMTPSRDASVVSIMMASAAVRKIDGAMFPFPRTREELDSTMGILDSEGLAAAASAFQKLTAADAPDSEGENAAKN